MNPSIHTLAAAALILSLPACAPEPTDGPPRIRFGVAECAECGMIISEERSAAAIITYTAGVRESLAFDDIGCMLDHIRKHADTTVARYVHDHDTAAWTPADSARYVLSPSTQTPMGSGISAYSTEAQAARAAAGAHPLNFTEVQDARARWLEDRRARSNSPPAPPGG